MNANRRFFGYALQPTSVK